MVVHDNEIRVEGAPPKPAACALRVPEEVHGDEKWESQIHFHEAGEIYTYDGFVSENQDELRRRLGNRQIQLLAIGGSIGTALFVSIGGALHSAGPAGLFMAYTIHSCMVGLVNNCLAEMTTLYPVSGGFLRLAGHFVDDAFGFMAGWNFFLCTYELMLSIGVRCLLIII